LRVKEGDTMHFKILGVDDSITSCDCCGKSNLKKTVALDAEGEIVYYGVNCAARALGFTDKTYSTRNASELVTRFNAREKLRQEKARLVAIADDYANKSGHAYVVTRRVIRGRVVHGCMKEDDYIRQNKFGVDVVYTSQPITTGGP
jgi:hypothetical protein